MSISITHAQELLRNGSFEGQPTKGLSGFVSIEYGSENGRYVVDSWRGYGSLDETVPDVHSKDSAFWEVTDVPYDGNTFIGLITRPNGTSESIFQVYGRSDLLKKDTEYRFKIFAKQSSKYLGDALLRRKIRKVDFIHPVVLKFYGIINKSVHRELFFTTDSIHTNEWMEIVFNFESTNEFRGVVIEAAFPDESKFNAGHVLIDNASLVVIKK